MILLPFSKKQLKVLSWWMPDSPVKHYEGIICDGSIRSGKTVSEGISFLYGYSQRSLPRTLLSVVKPLIPLDVTSGTGQNKS